jgi:hypothetical protein
LFESVADIETERRKRGRPPGKIPPLPGQDEEYDPDTFYTRASDVHGHSGNLTTPHSKDYLPIYQRIVDEIPEYRGSVQALDRDAMYHRVHYLAGRIQDDAFQEQVKQAERMAQSEAREARVEGWLNGITVVEKRLEKLKEIGWREGMVEELETFKEWADGLPVAFRDRAMVVVERWEARIPKGDD